MPHRVLKRNQNILLNISKVKNTMKIIKNWIFVGSMTEHCPISFCIHCDEKWSNESMVPDKV